MKTSGLIMILVVSSLIISCTINQNTYIKNNSALLSEKNKVYVYSYNKPYYVGGTVFYVLIGDIFKKVSTQDGLFDYEWVYWIKEKNDTSFLRPLYTALYDKGSWSVRPDNDTIVKYGFFKIIDGERQPCMKDTVVYNYIKRDGDSLVLTDPSFKELLPNIASSTMHFIDYSKNVDLRKEEARIRGIHKDWNETGFHYDKNLIYVYDDSNSLYENQKAFYLLSGNIFSQVITREGHLIKEFLFHIKERNDTAFLAPLCGIKYNKGSFSLIEIGENNHKRSVHYDYFLRNNTSLILKSFTSSQFDSDTLHIIDYTYDIAQNN